MKLEKRFAAGQAVAEQSEGRIVLSVEESVAVLRGEFTRKDRQPLRFKKGAAWRYRTDDEGNEFWTLNIERLENKPEPPKPEPKAEAVYVRWNDGHPELFHVTRATEKSVWLVGADGKEFRKAVGKNAEHLSGDFFLVR